VDLPFFGPHPRGASGASAVVSKNPRETTVVDEKTRLARPMRSWWHACFAILFRKLLSLTKINLNG
jgi:hypothetical protein